MNKKIIQKYFLSYSRQINFNDSSQTLPCQQQDQLSSNNFRKVKLQQHNFQQCKQNQTQLNENIPLTFGLNNSLEKLPSIKSCRASLRQQNSHGQTNNKKNLLNQIFNFEQKNNNMSQQHRILSAQAHKDTIQKNDSYLFKNQLKSRHSQSQHRQLLYFNKLNQNSQQSLQIKTETSNNLNQKKVNNAINQEDLDQKLVYKKTLNIFNFLMNYIPEAFSQSLVKDLNKLTNILNEKKENININIYQILLNIENKIQLWNYAKSTEDCNSNQTPAQENNISVIFQKNDITNKENQQENLQENSSKYDNLEKKRKRFQTSYKQNKQAASYSIHSENLNKLQIQQPHPIIKNRLQNSKIEIQNATANFPQEEKYDNNFKVQNILVKNQVDFQKLKKSQIQKQQQKQNFKANYNVQIVKSPQQYINQLNNKEGNNESLEQIITQPRNISKSKEDIVLDNLNIQEMKRFSEYTFGSQQIQELLTNSTEDTNSKVVNNKLEFDFSSQKNYLQKKNLPKNYKFSDLVKFYSNKNKSQQLKIQKDK